MTVFKDDVQDADRLATDSGLRALVLIRERTAIREALLERLPACALSASAASIRTSTSRRARASASWSAPTCMLARLPIRPRSSPWPGPRGDAADPQQMASCKAAAGRRRWAPAERQDARPLRLGPDWEGGRRLRRGVRHARPRLGATASRRAARDGLGGREQGGLLRALRRASLHLRLVPSTLGIVETPDLARMKPKR